MQKNALRFIPLIMIACVVLKSYHEFRRLNSSYPTVESFGVIENSPNATSFKKLTPRHKTLGNEHSNFYRKTELAKRASLKYPEDSLQNLSVSSQSLFTNIVFIKLHKVGGSTFQSVLHRFARENSLSIASIRDRWPTTRHIFAHHSTLQDFLHNPVVPRAVFLTLLRNPLDHACSCFYWNWNGKQFRRETPGNFSADHLHFLSVYSRQNKTAVVDDRSRKVINLTYTRQWNWFANSSMEAIPVLGELNFTIGFMEVRVLRSD